MTTDTVDYAPVIRAELERTIADLKEQMEGRTYPAEDRPDNENEQVTAQYAVVGDLANSHKGMPVLQEGEVVAGLPIRIGRECPRTVKVVAKEVEFVEEWIDTDGDSRHWHYTQDVVEEAIL